VRRRRLVLGDGARVVRRHPIGTARLRQRTLHPTNVQHVGPVSHAGLLRLERFGIFISHLKLRNDWQIRKEYSSYLVSNFGLVSFSSYENDQEIRFVRRPWCSEIEEAANNGSTRWCGRHRAVGQLVKYWKSKT
jgi:hypothetical protein